MAAKGVRLLCMLGAATALGSCSGVASQRWQGIETSHSDLPASKPLLPPFGLRIASATDSPNLLPSPAAAGPEASFVAGAASIPLAALPSPMARETQPERVHGEKSIESSSEPFLFADYGTTTGVMESGVASAERMPFERVSETRFFHEMPSQLFAELTDGWSDEFLLVAQTLPGQAVSGAFAGVPALDPLAEERHHSGWLRGKKKLTGSMRDGAKDTTVGAPVMDQLRDWRNEPVNFVLALLGGGLEQETPEGGKLIFGSQLSELSTSDNPAELVKVRYLFGPFEARAQTREAWARLRTELLGCSLSLRTAYKYLDQDRSYQLTLSRALSESTTLRVVGGTGIGSETLHGYSPYPEDPREEERVALMLLLDRRF